jgi:zinc transport system substrate-binding protein
VAGDDRSAEALVRVAVSVPPQAWLVSAVGGERVKTSVLVPPGSAPETFEPAPRQMAVLMRSDVVVAVGHPAFPFEDRFLRSLEEGAGAEDVRVVRMVGGSGAPARSRSAQESGDPHVWLSPPVMAGTARRLAAALAQVDPSHDSEYEARLGATLAEIERVEAQTRRLLDDVEERRFLVVHPAWGSFASHFGLEQVAIEEEGKEPSPARLAALIREAREEGVDTLFVQRGFSRRSAEVLAAEVGATLVELDPLGRDWPRTMLETARALAAAE